MKAYGITDCGKVREMNQDSYATAELGKNAVIAVLCDGMGGPSGGQIASEMACRVVIEQVREKFEGKLSEEKNKEMLKNAVIAANQAVFDEALRVVGLLGMGTTVVAALVIGEKAYVVNVGDSRCYQISDGTIFQVSHDHSVVQEMVDRGELSRLTAKNHPRKNIITKAVGVRNTVEPDVFTAELAKHDMLFLCSDGLSNMVDDEEISMELSLSAPEEVLPKLVALANERGGTDNITAVLLA